MNTMMTYTYTENQVGVMYKEDTDILIEPTTNTPFVKFIPSQYYLEIKGNSAREDILRFYTPIIDAFKLNCVNGKRCEMKLFFRKMNTSTVKILFDLLKFLRGEKQKGCKVNVTWCADLDDVDMLETGIDFSELFGLNFDIKSV